MITITFSLKNGEKINLPYAESAKALQVFTDISDSIKSSKPALICTTADTIVLIPRVEDICAIVMHPSKEGDEAPTVQSEMHALQLRHLKIVTELEGMKLKEMQRENQYRSDDDSSF